MDDADTSRDPASNVFTTPAWLERSFVLPVREVTAVPAQHVPRHDDLAQMDVDQARQVPAEGPAPTTDPTTTPGAQPYVRPPSTEIDFALVIRRAAAARRAHRTATVSAGLTGLALIGYLVSASPLILPILLVGFLVVALSCAVRLRLRAAPIPHLDR